VHQPPARGAAERAEAIGGGVALVRVRVRVRGRGRVRVRVRIRVRFRARVTSRHAARPMASAALASSTPALPAA